MREESSVTVRIVAVLAAILTLVEVFWWSSLPLWIGLSKSLTEKFVERYQQVVLLCCLKNA